MSRFAMSRIRVELLPGKFTRQLPEQDIRVDIVWGLQLYSSQQRTCNNSSSCTLSNICLTMLSILDQLHALAECFG